MWGKRMPVEKKEQWSVVGSFKKRPVPHSDVIDLLYDGDEPTEVDAPILLYDMNKGDDGPQVPKYVAQKVAIPPSSVDQKLKSISLAPPQSQMQGDEKEALNLACAEPAPLPVPDARRVKQKKKFVLVTSLPGPSQLSYALPLVIFLLDIAVLVASLTTQRTSKQLIAACCVLVLVPDTVSLVLIIKKGLYTTTIALHLLLWPNVVLLFLQPFTSLLFVTHLILTTLFVMFVLRVRGSLYCKFYTLH